MLAPAPRHGLVRESVQQRRILFRRDAGHAAGVLRRVGSCFRFPQTRQQRPNLVLWNSGQLHFIGCGRKIGSGDLDEHVTPAQIGCTFNRRAPERRPADRARTVGGIVVRQCWPGRMA